MNNLNKISFLVPNTGSSQLAFYLINEINSLSETRPEIDAIIYCENRHKNCMPANFAVMSLPEAWGNEGPVVATTLSTAEKLISFNSTKKIFDVWDVEWIRNQQGHSLEYENYIDIYTNNKLTLVARSKSHRDIIENAFNRKVDHIVSDFNMSQMLEVIK